MTEATQTPTLDLSPLLLPEAPHWWPLQWGWWSLAASIIISIIITLFIIRRNKKKQASKRAALRLFSLTNQPLTPSSALELLRQAALSYYPRETIAPLSGNEWYAFLDEQLNQPLFAPKQALWQQALYQNKQNDSDEQLVQDCQLWIQKALPPKRGRRG
ncbi:DUF4381 domain-containing protein [Vibrio sp. 99-70-13A1]|uniref:DUF4381 domain-containing protein n=1 Tax=Vibrio sp. 99-70-13A1 TaxID=2607601 RepID=UPI00149366C5|nr:DUF4381 domain-containing protein [Vibrio sp. 99-70-13A1]NOH97139.1 DUF4381 domain-containing protein [Vibrio sp. 99-70-13A1]